MSNLWPAKCVIAFYCTKKLLSLWTDIQRSQHSVRALKSTACYLPLFCTGPGQNDKNTTTATLLLSAVFTNRSYCVHRATWQKMLGWVEWREVCGKPFYFPASYWKDQRLERIPLFHLKMRDDLLYWETTHSKASLKAHVQTVIEWY